MQRKISRQIKTVKEAQDNSKRIKKYSGGLNDYGILAEDATTRMMIYKDGKYNFYRLWFYILISESMEDVHLMDS